MYLCESTSGALHNQGFGGKSWNHSWRRHLKKQSTKQLSCVYVIKPTRRALFILFQEEVSWKSSPSVQKNPQPDWRTAPSCSNPLEKTFRHSSSFFCSCDTCNCASVRSKAKQKLVVPVVEWETSKESTSVTESGGEIEPSEPLLRAGSCCLSRFWQVTSPQQFPVSLGHCWQHPGRIPFGAITFCLPRTPPDVSLGHNTPLPVLNSCVMLLCVV